MSFKKFRWSQVYESSEEELIDFMHARNVVGERVHAAADAANLDQHTDGATTIWCAEGSLTVKTESSSISLQPGDAIRLDSNTTFTIRPGIADCVYYLSR